MISDRYWRSRFGSDPSVVGKVISANLVQITIVGVLPAEFTGIQQPVAQPADITFPLHLDSQITPPPVVNGVALARLTQPTYWWLQVMGRLKPSITPASYVRPCTKILVWLTLPLSSAGFESVVSSLLFGVPKNDAISIALAIGVLGVVATIAAYLPARRASRVDPMVALRNE